MNLTDFSGQRPRNMRLRFQPLAQISIMPLSRTLSRLELFRLASATHTTRKSAERDDLLVFGHIPEVCIGLGELESCQRCRDFPHVFEVGAQVLAAGAGR